MSGTLIKLAYFQFCLTSLYFSYTSHPHPSYFNSLYKARGLHSADPCVPHHGLIWIWKALCEYNRATWWANVIEYQGSRCSAVGTPYRGATTVAERKEWLTIFSTIATRYWSFFFIRWTVYAFMKLMKILNRLPRNLTFCSDILCSILSIRFYITEKNNSPSASFFICDRFMLLYYLYFHLFYNFSQIWLLQTLFCSLVSLCELTGKLKRPNIFKL